MEHSFNIDIAREYGIPCAILLKHIYYWTEKNRANEKHFIEGDYWTYCSIKAFCELFPYMSPKVIRSALNKLEECDLIKSGCFNLQNYDRTKWYALSEKGKCLCQNGQFDFAKRANGNSQKGEPIPNSYTDTKTTVNKSSYEDYKGDSDEPPTKRANRDEEIVELWNSLQDCGIPPIKSMTPNRQKMLKARFREYGEKSFAEVVEKVRESDFLKGRVAGRTPFVATFDWVIRPNNYPKVLEGNYDNRNSKKELRGADAFMAIALGEV